MHDVTKWAINMEVTETDFDLDSTLAGIQALSATVRETIKVMAETCSPMLIIEAGNILEDVERLETAYLSEVFIHELEAEFKNQGKKNAA